MSAYEGSTDSFSDMPAASSGEDTQPLPPAGHGAAEPISPMQTAIRRFSRGFDSEFRPLLEPVRKVLASLTLGSLPPRLRAVLPTLRDLQHQVQMLADKVAQQQAYVLIFGPLKSGKSTFMNALCSTYVSEVTSLPAYPCIVSVSHSQSPTCLVTRYDGTSQTFSDQAALYRMVLQAHGELTGSIRQVESAGEQFDPATHMPEAIRRIDVKLPTPVLADSGAVLVDTPGLYSRMKFGYDRMTRDFRHAAACAIFVVKTDNLFLEQVFEEFNELLELFSRIFLVVNLDVTKKDLSCDGRLVPSLEQANPQAIIQAFRDLTMSLPLKAACEAGRLNIYPVDLLGAASRRIRMARGAIDEQDEAWLDEHDDDHFDALMDDLTRYLNSNEYLQEFLSDSLRRASALVGELGDLVEHEALRDLSAQMTALRDEHRRAKTQVEALERLIAADFAHQAQSLQESLLAGAVQQAQEIRDQSVQAVTQIIDGWFQDDSSLKVLREGRLEPLLNSARDRLNDYLRGELARQIDAAGGGLSLTPQQADDLKTISLGLGQSAQSALREALPGQDLPPLRSNLESDQVPVRKRFWDYIFFRSRSSIRTKLLGPSDNPARPAPVEAKAGRLGEAARQKMNELAVNQFETMLEAFSRYTPEEMVHAYAHQLAKRVGEELTQLRQQMVARLADLGNNLAEVQHVVSDVHALDEQVQQSEQGLHTLREEFLGNPAPAAQQTAEPVQPAPQQTAEPELPAPAARQAAKPDLPAPEQPAQEAPLETGEVAWHEIEESSPGEEPAAGDPDAISLEEPAEPAQEEAAEEDEALLAPAGEAESAQAVSPQEDEVFLAAAEDARPEFPAEPKATAEPDLEEPGKTQDAGDLSDELDLDLLAPGEPAPAPEGQYKSDQPEAAENEETHAVPFDFADLDDEDDKDK